MPEVTAEMVKRWFAWPGLEGRHATIRLRPA